MALVLQCDEANYDASTQTCSAPYYGDAPMVIPTLTADQGMTIGVSFALLWATAWGIRMCKRALNRIG